MQWLPLALLTAGAFASYTLFMKVASDKIDQVVGAFVLQLVAATFGALVLAALWASGHSLRVTPAGLQFAALAGLCVGVAEVLSFYVFARGAPVSLATPVIMGGSVAFAALAGMLLLQERMNPLQALGALLVTAGIGLLASQGRG